MVNLIDDGSLVGLWPLNEPSGAPSWKNFSPAYAGHPSGLSFDFLVHTASNGSILDAASVASPWPGTTTIFNPHSGVLVNGLQLQGKNDRVTSNSSAPFSKMLILGNGTFAQRTETLAPAVANSGFTAGIWVYPMSDGWLDAQNGGFSTATDTWYVGFGRVHALFGQWDDDIGWYMGVSGALAGATQFSNGEFGGPHQLRAYLLCDVATGTTPKLDTPIESGRYTHLTMTYRYVDGNSNELAFYKDGRLAASGITSQDIVFDATPGTGPENGVLNIGGSNDGTYGIDAFEFTSGWNHLVSGAYLFRRVLHEGEILELHQRGGLQPDYSLRDNTTSVSILDDNLVAYVEQKAPGWVDSSKNHYSFISDRDPGDRASSYTWDPGPFNTNRAYSDGSNLGDFICAPSGATFEVAEGPGGFTICGHFQPFNTTNDRDGSMMISFGSVSAATATVATPATVSTNSLGIMLSYIGEAGFGDRIILEVFPVGDGTDGAIALRASGEQVFRNTNVHYGIVYDAITQGIALYLDGYEAASGTLSHALQPHLLNLAGSGFPVMFMNGVTDQIADSITHGVFINGGDGGSSGPFAIFSRPLGAGEMRFMAQSGIDTSATWRTRYDSRLMGYWPCSDIDNSDVCIEDFARAMSPVLGHLTRGDTLTKWERVYNLNNTQSDEDVFRNDGTAFIDLYGVRTLPPELASYGALGITSGIFQPLGGSQFAGGINTNVDERNTPFNHIIRYNPATEERDLAPQSLHEYIISFEVTPSGNIPSIDAASQGTSAQQKWFNSRLHTHGNLATSTTDGEFFSMLTTQNAISPDPLGAAAGLGGSGVTIAFVARDGSTTTAITPVISGTLPFGVPTRVLFHAKFEEPYRINDFLVGNSPMSVALWINGNKVNERSAPATDLRMWSDQQPDNVTADWLLSFGGTAVTDAITTQQFADGGLGEIYMREIFIMRGIFEAGEIAALAASGIQNPTLNGFVSSLPKTQVSLADSDLQGYWRFNGFDGNVGQVSNSPGGSGTTDLSFKSHHLDAIAQRYYEQGTSVDMAETLRAMPGPLRNSDLGIQCSGFHNQSILSASDGVNSLPPFAVSGVGFDNPAAGFSVGFLLAKREDIASAAGFDCMMCYGVLTTPAPNGTVTDTTFDPNRGWAIGMDDGEQIKMIMSVGGSMFLDNSFSSTASSGQVVCGVTNTGNPLLDGRSWNKRSQGNFNTPGLDAWSHLCWVYDPSPAGGSGLRCYLNGILVDEQFVQSWNSDGTPLLNPFTGTPAAPQTPVAPEARMITFKSHMAAGGPLWDFRNGNFIDADSLFTDVFYLSRALSEEEVRYVAFYGIDDAVGTPTSGIIGGFIHGQDTGSGLIGGYHRGQDIGSGLIGGFVPGGFLGSGSLGGYVSGVIFGDGTLGGWIRGLDDVSGILGGFVHGLDVGSGSIAGYIRGQTVGSGHFGGLIFGSVGTSGNFGGYLLGSDQGSGLVGGFMLGALQGNFEFDGGFTLEVIAAEDFDAQLEIAKTISSDFDAKVVIFQNEQPPLVDIIIPDATVTGLVPPFNQYFIGNASGLQGKTITSTRWTFGDLTPPVTTAESGAGYYPVQHMYTGSGFFIAKFEAIDSDGMHASATRIINAASGIDPVIVSLSGVPRAGEAELIVDFTTTIDILPPGVSISTKLLNFDDGQTTISFNPTHNYTQPGVYKPIWCVRDSRGIIWCDSLESGNDFLTSGGA